MSDQVSKSMTKVAWVLIAILGIAITASITFGFIMLLLTPGLPVYIKLLVVAGVIGFGLLLIVVIRDRIQEHKNDKYKDIEV